MSTSFDRSWDYSYSDQNAAASTSAVDNGIGCIDQGQDERLVLGVGSGLDLRSQGSASTGIIGGSTRTYTPGYRSGPQRLVRKAALAVQTLAYSLTPTSLSSRSTALSTAPYKSLPTSPYTSSSRRRSSSSSHHRDKHHLPRRRLSNNAHSSFSPWTFSARTRWAFLAFLLLAVGIITGITKLIIYILNPDKEPKTWQYFCTSQQEFPHALADTLAPVDVFVGVFSIDSSYERRQLIRSTYATHTLPRDVLSGAQLANVQVKFILGRPRKLHARRVALEMETYNDIVVLDMEENMNQGKTYAYFRWASENATVPILLSQEPEHVQQQDLPLQTVVGWKKADYVVKADDDAFIVLSELERHLRVSPRTGTYWGYLIRNWFMGGECYALSNDLVQYIATSPDVIRYTHGKEDKKVAQWMNLHPNATGLNWVSERCWIYDGPKAGTAYSHGYLFPDYVATLRRNALKEASLEGESSSGQGEEVQGESGSSSSGALVEPRRSAEWRRKHSASTVSKWKQPYVVPRAGMSIEEEIEALVEGGGRWDGTWVRPAHVAASPFEKDAYRAGSAPILTSSASSSPDFGDATAEEHEYAAAREDFGADPRVWVPFDTLVFESNDVRLRPTKEAADAPLFRTDLGSDPDSGLALYNVSNVPLAGWEKAQLAAGETEESRPLVRRASTSRDAKAPHAASSEDDFRNHDDNDNPDTLRRRLGEQHSAAQQQQHLIPGRYVPLATGGRRRPELEVGPQHAHRSSFKVSTDPGAAAGSDPSGLGRADPERYYEGPADVLRRGNLTPEQRLRARRYLYRPHGGTVVVHFLKKSEWFLETAIALLGKDVLWPNPNAGAASSPRATRPTSLQGGAQGVGDADGFDGTTGLGGRAREWRMWGSPVVVRGPTDKEMRVL